MSLLFAVSTSLGFSSSHRLLLSDPATRVSLCDMVVTRSPCPYNHLTDHIATTRVGLSFSYPRRFTAALGTYREKPTRPISHTHKSSGIPPSHSPQPYLSTPILNPNNAVISGRSPSPPFFGFLPGGFLWLGPIDLVCVPLVPHSRCVTGDGS